MSNYKSFNGDDDPETVCPKCHETGPLIEKVCPPIWFSRGATLYVCNVCSATWTVYPKKPSALI